MSAYNTFGSDAIGDDDPDGRQAQADDDADDAQSPWADEIDYSEPEPPATPDDGPESAFWKALERGLLP